MSWDKLLFEASFTDINTPSKKNDVRYSRYGRPYHSKKAEMEVITNKIKSHIKKGFKMIEEPVFMWVLMSGNNRNDFNNQVTTLCDSLEDAGVLKNDRQILEMATKKVIKKPDLVIIRLFPYDPDEYIRGGAYGTHKF